MPPSCFFNRTPVASVEYMIHSIKGPINHNAQVRLRNARPRAALSMTFGGAIARGESTSLLPPLGSSRGHFRTRRTRTPAYGHLRTRAKSVPHAARRPLREGLSPRNLIHETKMAGCSKLSRPRRIDRPARRRYGDRLGRPHKRRSLRSQPVGRTARTFGNARRRRDPHLRRP